MPSSVKTIRVPRDPWHWHPTTWAAITGDAPAAGLQLEVPARRPGSGVRVEPRAAAAGEVRIEEVSDE